MLDGLLKFVHTKPDLYKELTQPKVNEILKRQWFEVLASEMGGGGRNSRYPHSHYRCPRRYVSGVAAGSELCTEPLIKGGLVEYIARDYIIRLMEDPVEFEAKLHEAQANEAAAVQPAKKELDHVIAMLEHTEKEAEKIAHAIRKAKGIIAATLEHQGDEVNKLYEEFTRRKGELQKTLAVELTENMIGNLLRFRELAALGLENPTFEDQRRWLEILQTRVTVTNGIAGITCRLSGEPLTYNLFETGTQQV